MPQAWQEQASLAVFHKIHGGTVDIDSQLLSEFAVHVLVFDNISIKINSAYLFNRKEEVKLR